jgi:hypothetical protein
MYNCSAVVYGITSHVVKEALEIKSRISRNEGYAQDGLHDGGYALHRRTGVFVAGN